MIKYYLPEGMSDLTRSTTGSSGYDLRTSRNDARVIEPGQRMKVPTGLHLEMHYGVEAQVRSRSGLAMNHGVVVLGAPCTIDSDYRGEVFVMLINHGNQPYEILPGDRVAQLVFADVVVPIHEIVFKSNGLYRVKSLDGLSMTERDRGGFGSTGR